MNLRLETIRSSTGESAACLASDSRDAVIVSTHFCPADKLSPQGPGSIALDKNSQRLISECVRLLKFNGRLWLYGLPRELAVWGAHLSEFRGQGWRTVFKYWFALDIDAAPRNETLAPSHLGLLLFLKEDTSRKSPAKLELDTDAARMPHLNCAACHRTLKDWGGKRHLMNPKGAAPSDVWRDLPRRRINDSVIPGDVLARVAAMSLHGGRSGLHVIQTEAASFGSSSLPVIPDWTEPKSGTLIGAVEPDTVHHGDCVTFLNRVAESHPDGLFDLAFADPPYNLEKLYGTHDDAMAEHKYLAWCNAWLAGMARALKPGGSLLVLNLPKWALHHAAFLNRLLEFRHWIVWDALSDPRGKIMPAHYALLWFTKPGAKLVCNYKSLKEPLTPAFSPLHEEKEDGAHRATRLGNLVLPPDSPKYCLRAACVRDRKARGEDEKVELTDVWFDVHRLKHKRDRDAHPCQLPEKLMERIIKLTTHPGGWVFDPFCGAGTTAIAATKLGRTFVVTDVDESYVRITREKLAAMKSNADLFGSFVVPRAPTKKPRREVSKREVELYLQGLAKRLGRPLVEEDVATDNAAMLAKMDALYPNRGAALKRAKLALAR